MSLYIIPQKALDSLSCDFCRKYLSVTPVKVFPNRSMKCGRCISEDDGGVISMYNEVAKKSIFKCINHYEGCKALLSTSEVHKHEQTCKSKKYKCPNCNEKIPSYFMYKHFTINHKELILKNPYFVVNDSERLVHFLYCNNDYLIFVKYSSHKEPYNDCIKTQFKFSLLNSKSAETLKVNVLINCSNVIKEKEMDCDVFPLESGNDFKVELDLKDPMLAVSFSLEELKFNVTVQKAVITTENVEIPKENYIHTITKTINKRPSESLGNKLSVELLNRYFKRKNELKPYYLKEFAWLCNSSKNRVKEIRFCDVVFACPMCSLEYAHHSSGYYVVYECKKYYLICFMCQLAQNLPQKFWVSYESVSNIYLRCKWGCGNLLDLDKFLKHEKYCEQQILQPCPVKLCNHSCKLFEIQEHFEEDHPDLQSPVFHELWYGESLNLIPTASPLKIIYIVSHIYIGIELIWDKSVWKISLTCTIPNARPRMIILKDQKFVTLIKGHGSCNSFGYINYKCYLEDPIKEGYLQRFEEPVKKKMRIQDFTL